MRTRANWKLRGIVALDTLLVGALGSMFLGSVNKPVNLTEITRTETAQVQPYTQIQVKTCNLAQISDSQASQGCSPQPSQKSEPQESYGCIDYGVIEKIESAGNTRAFNKNSKATGLRQITPVVLEEWNQKHGNERYNLSDLFNPDVNRKIGNWYMGERIPFYFSHLGLKDSIENRLAAYNWGIGNVKKLGGITNENFGKLPTETQNYIEKYKRIASEK